MTLSELVVSESTNYRQNDHSRFLIAKLSRTKATMVHLLKWPLNNFAIYVSVQTNVYFHTNTT